MDQQKNPYSAPEAANTAEDQQPGFLARLFIAALSTLAGVCTWYCTCGGFMMLGHLGSAILALAGFILSITLSIPAGSRAARWTERKLKAMLMPPNESSAEQN